MDTVIKCSRCEEWITVVSSENEEKITRANIQHEIDVHAKTCEWLKVHSIIRKARGND